MSIFLEDVRRKAFWLKDQMNDGAVRKNLEEIEFIVSSPASNESKRKRQHYLDSLLDHAVKSTPYYSRNNLSRGLESFGVIDKNIIRDNFRLFQTSSRLGKLRRVTTSGSTGTPFSVLQDNGKRQRQAAENIFFNTYCRFPVGARLYFLRIWNEINRMNFASRFVRNIVPVDASRLTTDKALSLINRLEADNSTKSLLAYSSTWEAILRNLEELKIDSVTAHTQSIVGMAEGMAPEVRSRLGSIFGCPVLLRYSNSENGFIAHQTSMVNDHYLINTASFVVELLKFECDEPVEEGASGRIVVTDLFNYAMPIIRYDTGDVGRIGSDESGRPVFVAIEGRRLDFIYKPTGEMLSPHVIDYAIRRTGVSQFQFIQKGRSEYLVRINVGKATAYSEREMLDSLRVYVGEAAQLQVEYVDEIPLLASGKRSIVVNQMGRGVA